MPDSNVKSSRIDAGWLDKRITLLRPAYNEYQDEITDWVPAATVWASVEPVFAQELTEAERTVETTMVIAIIRYRKDIDARWRVQDHEHLYQVRGLADITRRREQLQLRLSEVL
jgi:SPP1 family predicted phage head-tail adaptor